MISSELLKPRKSVAGSSYSLEQILMQAKKRRKSELIEIGQSLMRMTTMEWHSITKLLEELSEVSQKVERAVWSWMTHGPVILRNIMIKLERVGGQYDYRRQTDEENTGSEWT